MKLKIYKPVLLTAAGLLIACSAGMAQKKHHKVKAKQPATVTINVDSKDFEAGIDDLPENLTALTNNLKDLGKNLSATITNSLNSSLNIDVNDADDEANNAEVNLNLGNLLNNLKVNISANGDSDGDDEIESANTGSVREKNYSKSYPLDANDKIRLSNQFGKISVNTWNRNEIKVDISIKAEAGSDADAQRLIDGVSISDGKSGDQVSFKTNITSEDDDNGFWALFRSKGNKRRKLSINYSVYMPSKTDLDVNSSYGSVDLPALDGKLRMNVSNGSTSVESLSNPANEINGSYGSLKIGSMNGGKLSFSYGSVDMDEVNNLKADLDYGSFKLGKLKGSGDFDLSYEGGFKIDNVESSLKHLNINTSYSGASLGLSPNSNFDFDVTVSYGGFNYNDDKVDVTSKNPPDGSRHIGTTRNYKGHVGKGNPDARVTINTSYGGVRFE
ncbi:hypothetical protein [Mucilaginibacter sp. L3T2-6]|uniref:hypothetical protein n=1 Tax=Mucilaginibacter sp. L3T2-6 TaxID=3062491 RepID=UPI002675DA8E|nr:hypothetical protein [Mucilaginibacter sp. L3T2-6]MDO3640362.1 hypothetical protein [Mucilaginibacter sp. L3T2-6]MDV6213299.1 hypothetical protein [Mucilaginibacter sp. L3T2-6]